MFNKYLFTKGFTTFLIDNIFICLFFLFYFLALRLCGNNNVLEWEHLYEPVIGITAISDARATVKYKISSRNILI